MKTLSALIKNLQVIEAEHGDLPIVYSSDDEGNSFQHVVYDAGVMDMVSDGRNLEPNDDDPKAIRVCCIN